MNLVLLEEQELKNDRVLLEDRRSEHLRRVLRVEPGRRIRLGIVGGRLGEGRVVQVSGKVVELQVRLSEEVSRESWIDLIVALPRPQALKRVLEYGAMMGVGKIELINAWRVEKSFFQTPLLEPATVRRQLLLGAEQGSVARLPEVTIERRFTKSLNALLESREPASTLRLIAHPEAADPAEVVSPRLAARPGGRALLALGPEGGWIDREVETFQRAGFHPVSLGPWILRVETALVAGLAQLELLRRRERPWPVAAC